MNKKGLIEVNLVLIYTIIIIALLILLAVSYTNNLDLEQELLICETELETVNKIFLETTQNVFKTMESKEQINLDGFEIKTVEIKSNSRGYLCDSEKFKLYTLDTSKISPNEKSGGVSVELIEGKKAYIDNTLNGDIIVKYSCGKETPTIKPNSTITFITDRESYYDLGKQEEYFLYVLDKRVNVFELKENSLYTQEGKICDDFYSIITEDREDIEYLGISYRERLGTLEIYKYASKPIQIAFVCGGDGIIEEESKNVIFQKDLDYYEEPIITEWNRNSDYIELPDTKLNEFSIVYPTEKNILERKPIPYHPDVEYITWDSKKFVCSAYKYGEFYDLVECVSQDSVKELNPSKEIINYKINCPLGHPKPIFNSEGEIYRYQCVEVD